MCYSWQARLITHIRYEHSPVQLRKSRWISSSATWLFSWHEIHNMKPFEQPCHAHFIHMSHPFHIHALCPGDIENITTITDMVNSFFLSHSQFSAAKENHRNSHSKCHCNCGLLTADIQSVEDWCNICLHKYDEKFLLAAKVYEKLTRAVISDRVIWGSPKIYQ